MPFSGKLSIALYWDAHVSSWSSFDMRHEMSGPHFDFDLMVAMYDETGRCVDAAYYDKHRSDDGSTRFVGDIQELNDEDELIVVDLPRVAHSVASIRVGVRLFGGNNSGERIGMVSDCRLRVIDQDTGVELLHFDLSEDLHDHHSAIVGEFVRTDDDGWSWNTRLQAVGDLEDAFRRSGSIEAQRPASPEPMRHVPEPAPFEIRMLEGGQHIVGGRIVAQGTTRGGSAH